MATVQPSDIVEKPPQLTVESFIRMKWYALRVLLLAEFIVLGAAGNMIYMIYAGAAPKSVSCNGENVSIVDICKTNPSDWRYQDCDWTPRYEFRSVNVEFEHLCAEKAYVKTSISIQMAGVLLGAVFWGHISDTFGRKTALMYTVTATSLLSLACSFSWDLMSFTIMRTIMAFFNGGSLAVYAVYKTEHLTKKHRFIIASLIAWSPNLILVNGIAYLCGDWRTLQRALFAASSPALLLFFFVYESPRFLIQRGRLDEARDVLSKIQEIDGVSSLKKEDMNRMINDEHERQIQRQNKTKRYNYSHLLRIKDLRIPSAVFCVGIMSISMSSFGILYSLDALSGSLFVNSLYLGLLRLSVNILCGLADVKFPWLGRRILHSGTLGTIATMMAVMAIVNFSGIAEEFANVVRVCTLIAAACFSQLFITKEMAGMEYFPTPIRNSAISVMAMSNRLGSVLAPLVFLYLPTPWLYTLLCLTAVLDCVAYLLVIPETKGHPLPDRMPEDKESMKMKPIASP